MTDSEVRVGEALKDATLLALVMEEEAMSQGMQAVSRIQRRQGNVFSPGDSRRNAALPTSRLQTGKTHFGHLTSRAEMINLCGFKS